MGWDAHSPMRGHDYLPPLFFLLTDLLMEFFVEKRIDIADTSNLE